MNNFDSNVVKAHFTCIKEKAGCGARVGICWLIQSIKMLTYFKYKTKKIGFILKSNIRRLKSCLTITLNGIGKISPSVQIGNAWNISSIKTK